MAQHISVLRNNSNYRYLYTVSPDKIFFIKHDKENFNKGETVLRGFCSTINEKMYALLRDENNALWLLGEDISPLMITDAVTAEIEGTENDNIQRKFTIRKNGEVYLQLFYYRDLEQTCSLWYFQEDGDFGFFICEILGSSEKRKYIWTDEWYKGVHISSDAL